MNELLDLELDEVSLVDSPANKSATVALFKRDTSMAKAKKETTPEIEEIEKGVCIEIEIKTPEEELAEMQLEVQQETQDAAPMAKSAEEVAIEEVETLKAEVERLTKALEAKEEVEKAAEMVDFGGEMVAKSAIPAPVLKKLEEFQKAQEAEELRKRADEVLPNFKGTADQRGKLLKSVEGNAELEELLRAADAAFAGLFMEVGKTDAANDLLTAEQKLDTLVKSYQEDKKTDFYKAYAAVIKTAEGKSLLLETYKK